MDYQIILHGGANDLFHETEIRTKKCREIAGKVEKELKKGANALEACEIGVKKLEDAVEFNAGTGAFLQLDGQIRMDACIMDSNLRVGSVIQIQNVKNPISVARKLLEIPMHGILSGQGATNFAREQGFKTYNPAIQKQVNIYLQNIEKLENNLEYNHISQNYEYCSSDKLGTVGCVVRDTNGLIVAGTSTGGLKVCYPGRIGDSGIPGSGNYANKFAGISCTGVGEKILRLNLARLVSILIEEGFSLEKSLDEAMQKLHQIDGKGGIIAISHAGEIGCRFNSKTMSFAMIRSANLLQNSTKRLKQTLGKLKSVQKKQLSF